MRRRLHLAGLLLATACVVAAGCGGSDDSSSAAASSANAAADSGSSDQGAASTDAQSADQSAGQQSSDQKSGASGDVPELSDGAWQGTAHVQVSGDVDATFDAPGGGISQAGSSVLTFAFDEAATKGSQIALSPDQGSSVFVTVDNVSAGGNVGDKCSVSASTNDDAKAVVDFSCKGVEGVSTKDLKSYVVDIKGTFEVTRPA